MRTQWRPIAVLLLLASIPPAATAADGSPFLQHVAPILERRCLGCHDSRQHKGDFSLETAASAFSDGYITAGAANDSHLIEVITPVDGRARMPREGDPLTAREIAVIRDWIDQGAQWDAKWTLKPLEISDTDWWSLQPLERPSVPEATDPRLKNPIDAFIRHRLQEKNLTPAPPADRRTLIRRLYFDLIGLPPEPEVVERFVSDGNPLAYERLVDGLLNSHHYGERWARHWLDVVHYADTHGYDKDKLRPHAWPYRDYIIRSLNADKPYARFVMEQVAGDVLWPDTVDGLTATGFIAAGPWDFIGHAEVPESKIDGRIARHLDRDDMVTSTMNTFVSTTVQCARCHNHKFDPVTQEHYYSLQAVFAALDRADRPYDVNDQVARERWTLNRQREQLQAERQGLQQRLDALAGPRLAELRDQIERLETAAKNPSDKKPEFGYHSQIEPRPGVEKWVQVDLGRSSPVHRVEFVGAHDPFNGIGHGFGFPQRFKIEACNDSDFTTGVYTILDQTAADVPNPGTKPQSHSLGRPVTVRFVRFTATRLAERKQDYIFALGEFSVFGADNQNLAAGQPVTALDSIEAPVRWQKKNLVDGYHYGLSSTPEAAAELARLKSEHQQLVDQSLDDELRRSFERNRQSTQEVETRLSQLPDQQLVYAGTVHTGQGAFRGTGHDGGNPRPIHVLNRGNILQPVKPVQPGTLPFIPESDWRFALPANHSEGERRAALARWIVRADNPLTWRSIVNRVWQYHFGRGIVDTPNDFGRMGQQPTHPELLDWLAVEFRDGGQSLKNLHRLIVTSATYRQSSEFDEQNARIDAANTYLWRMSRRRLEAEEVRDAVLAACGQLDRSMYGPGFQLFVLERPQHSPHYEYHKHDPDDPASHRRSVYRFIVRSQPDPFMTTLDCADSSQSVAKRDETVTALQALSLLNNRFMLRMSEHFAARVQREADSTPARIHRAFELAVGQRPTDVQLERLTEYAEEFGMANTCRLVFNLNSFVFID